MIWDKRRRVYVNPDGSIVTPQQMRDRIELYIQAEKEVIGDEAESLIKAGASSIAITIFFNFMREKVKEIHGAAGLTAYGGADEMDPERWARVGEKIANEYEYLNGFEKAVYESRQATDEIIQVASQIKPSVQPAVIERVVLTNPPGQVIAKVETIVEAPVMVPEKTFESLIWGDVKPRARSYSDAVYATHENNVKSREQDAGVLSGRRVHEGDSSVCEDCINAASEEYVPLGDLLDIGDSRCQVRCRCIIEFDYHGIEPLVIDRSAYAGL
jgi:hypothetical protein